jgi:hypothetical protein
MNPVFSSLEEGYSPEEILGFLSKKIPQIVPSISKAKRSGYTVNQILGFLSKNFETESRRGMNESQIHAVNQRADSERVKYGLNLAATAAALPIAGIAARSALQRALPSSLTHPAQSIAHALPGANNSTNLGANNPSQSALGPTSQINPAQNQQSPLASQSPIESGNIAQSQQQLQPEVKTIDVSSLLEKSGLKKHVDELSQKVKDPKAIAGILYNKFPKEMKAFQQESGQNMEDAIGDYLSQNSVGGGMKPNEEMKPIEQQPAKIEKSSIVGSPNGIGEVKAIRNGKALIEIEGKKHEVNEDELIQSPLPEKDLADLYNDLVSGIEKESSQQVSRNVYWAGYDPNTNELAYLPHDGGLYVYDNISPEDAKELTGILNQRKSTGQNYIGVWEKGSSSPIGAAMYQMIKKLQGERGGKGNEYKNKFQKVYDALELAKTAAKKQYEERKKKAKKPRID